MADPDFKYRPVLNGAWRPKTFHAPHKFVRRYALVHSRSRVGWSQSFPNILKFWYPTSLPTRLYLPVDQGVFGHPAVQAS